MLSRRGNGLKQGDRLFGSFKYWYKAGSTRTRTILGDLFSKLWYTAEVKEIKNDGTARFKSAALDNAEFDFRLDSINSSRAFSKKLPEGDILMEVNLSDETLFTDKDPIDFLKVGSKTPLEKMSKNDLIKHTQELQEKLQVSLAFVSSQLETAGHGLRVKNGMQRAQNIPALQQNVLDQIETNLTEAEVQAEVQKVASSFSLSTPDFDAYIFYRGLLAMLIDKMHASLKKTDFSTGVREGKGFKLMCPKDFMFGTFCSIARLAGFRETRRKNGVVVLTGVVENMQALGVLSDSHPKLLDPYFHCVFIASQDAVFGSYYDQFRHTCREYDYEFIVNPWDWSLACLKNDDRIKREIGHQYFDIAGDTDEMARQRIVNALVQKRIAASDPSGENAPADAGMDGGGGSSSDTTQRRAHRTKVLGGQRHANYGFKYIASVNSNEPVVITLAPDADAAGTCSLHLHFSAALREFNGVADSAGRQAFNQKSWPKERRCNRKRKRCSVEEEEKESEDEEG